MTTSLSRPSAWVASALLCLCGHAAAQPTDVGEDSQIAPATIDSQDRFGLSVSVSGPLAVVGATRDEVGPGDAGTAHVYRNNGSGWSAEAVLSASDGAFNDAFGTAVAAAGDVIIVGAPLAEVIAVDQGAAYVYRFDGASWTQEQKLVASDGGTGHQFGAAVALSGDLAAVGSPQSGFGNGAVYVYRYDSNTLSWTEEAKLVDSGASPGAQLGTAVAVSGDVVMAGAPFQDGAGAVRTFDGPGGVWTAPSAIPAPAGVEGDAQFGHDVAFDGGRAIIGAHLDHVSGVADAGSAFVYTYDGSVFSLESQLTASSGSASDFFGFSVEICGDTAIVGAQFGDGVVADTGDAHVFRFDGASWSQESRLVASNGEAGDFFGYAVAGCDSAFIGAWGDVPAGFGGTRYGSVYVFDIAPPPVADTDGDGLDDDDEISLYGTDPFNADTDGDLLSDGDEVLVHFTDPLDLDTDDDLLTDGDEILSSVGGCPDPLVADSDGDGLEDGFEVVNFLDPCDADFDDDGLADGLEAVFGSDPTNPDTDGDGLLDGTEVDMAQGTGCPSPIVADSDGDNLTDAEEDLLGTDPCNSDTDGDGVADDVDDQPTIPGVTSGFIEDVLLDLARDTWALPLGEFKGRNSNAQRGRRFATFISIRIAARLISRDRDSSALWMVNRIISRLDGDGRPRDWMEPGAARDDLRAELELLADLIEMGF